MSPDRGSGQDSFFGNVSLTQRDRQTTYTLAFNAGYQQNQDTFCRHRLLQVLSRLGLGHAQP